MQTLRLMQTFVPMEELFLMNAAELGRHLDMVYATYDDGDVESINIFNTWLMSYFVSGRDWQYDFISIQPFMHYLRLQAAQAAQQIEDMQAAQEIEDSGYSSN